MGVTGWVGGGWASRRGLYASSANGGGRLDWADPGEMSLGGHWAGCPTHLDSSSQDPPLLVMRKWGPAWPIKTLGGETTAAASA